MIKMDLFHRFGCLALVVAICAPMSAWAQYNAFDDPPSAGSTAGAAGSLEFGPSKSEIEGGDITAGQTAQVIVMLRNNTSAPVTLKSIDLVPSSNVTAAIATNPCKEPVRPGIECPITISIKGEGSGKYRVGMLLNHDARSKISNIGITGNVAGGPGGVGGMPSNEIEAFPNAIDFGTAKGRAPLVRSITLHNSSQKPLKIESVDLVASPLTGFAVSAPDCTELQGGQSCVATVTWTPSVQGGAEGVLVLRHSGPSGGLQISLKGDYQITKTEKATAFPALVPGQGLVVADRESIDFGTAVDGASSITISLVNAGDKAVTLKAVKLAGSDNGLSLSNDDCRGGRTLEANQGCALTVNWLPRRPGPVIDDIQVIHDGARGVLVMPVRGTATQSVSTNMPMLGSNSLPKLPTSDLDEKVLGDVGKDSGGKTKKIKPALYSAAGSSMSQLSSDTSSLNGYYVSSLSQDRAVITGPRGRSVVQDGQPQVIAGGHWLPNVTAEGVELIGQDDSVFLLFDRSINASAGIAPSGPASFPATSGSAAPSTYSTTSSSTSSTSSSGTSATPSTGTTGSGVKAP
jgi:hypothetical protein